MCSAGLRAVLVKGIPTAAPPPVIKAHFSVCGRVTRLSLLRDRSTGERSNLAWVEFAGVKQAQKALKLTGSTLLLSRLTVWPKDSAEACAEVEQLNMHAFAATMPGPPGLPMPWGGGPGRGRGRGRKFSYVRDAAAGSGGGGAAAMDQSK